MLNVFQLSISTKVVFSHYRLKYNTKGLLTISGFSEPADADLVDIEIWKPHFAGWLILPLLCISIVSNKKCAN